MKWKIFQLHWYNFTCILYFLCILLMQYQSITDVIRWVQVKIYVYRVIIHITKIVLHGWRINVTTTLKKETIILSSFSYIIISDSLLKK